MCFRDRHGRRFSVTAVPAKNLAENSPEGGATSKSVSTSGSTSSASSSSQGTSSTRTSSPARPPVKNRRVVRFSARALLLSTVLVYTAYAKYNEDWFLLGPRRGFWFWWRVGPVVAAYVYHAAFKMEPDDDWSALHAWGSDVTIGVISDLRGFYVKCGQFSSARPDVMPPVYIEKLRKLQDELPPSFASKADIEDMLGQYYANSCSPDGSFGDSRKHPFASFDPRSLGAASIGQTHRARLSPEAVEVLLAAEGAPLEGSDKGKKISADVVFKIQYPTAELLFYVDIQCVRTVFRLLAPELMQLLDELKKQFLFEFDYRAELNNCQRMAENMRSAKNQYFVEGLCEVGSFLTLTICGGFVSWGFCVMCYSAKNGQIQNLHNSG